MIYYLKLYGQYVKLSFRSLLAYRADFLVGSIGFLISAGAMLFSLFVVFQFTDAIGGWDVWQVLFLYAFTSLGGALWDTFMINMIFLGNKIRDGSFDQLMLRPVDPLFQLIAEKMDPDTIGEAVFSIILCGICLYHYDLVSIGSILLFLCLVISTVFTFASIHLFANTTAFWIIETRGVTSIIWTLNRFTMYPMSVYPKWIVRLFTFVVPFGFVGYYPIRLMLGNSNEVVDFLSIVIGPLLFMLVYGFWRLGLRRYQSTGS